MDFNMQSSSDIHNINVTSNEQQPSQSNQASSQSEDTLWCQDSEKLASFFSSIPAQQLSFLCNNEHIGKPLINVESQQLWFSFTSQLGCSKASIDAYHTVCSRLTSSPILDLQAWNIRRLSSVLQNKTTMGARMGVYEVFAYPEHLMSVASIMDSLSAYLESCEPPSVFFQGEMRTTTPLPGLLVLLFHPTIAVRQWAVKACDLYRDNPATKIPQFIVSIFAEVVDVLARDNLYNDPAEIPPSETENETLHLKTTAGFLVVPWRPLLWHAVSSFWNVLSPSAVMECLLASSKISDCLKTVSILDNSQLPSGYKHYPEVLMCLFNHARVYYRTAMADALCQCLATLSWKLQEELFKYIPLHSLDVMHLIRAVTSNLGFIRNLEQPKSMDQGVLYFQNFSWITSMMRFVLESIHYQAGDDVADVCLHALPQFASGREILFMLMTRFQHGAIFRECKKASLICAILMLDCVRSPEVLLALMDTTSWELILMSSVDSLAPAFIPRPYDFSLNPDGKPSGDKRRVVDVVSHVTACVVPVSLKIMKRLLIRFLTQAIPSSDANTSSLIVLDQDTVNLSLGRESYNLWKSLHLHISSDFVQAGVLFPETIHHALLGSYVAWSKLDVLADNTGDNIHQRDVIVKSFASTLEQSRQVFRKYLTLMIHLSASSLLPHIHSSPVSIVPFVFIMQSAMPDFRQLASVIICHCLNLSANTAFPVSWGKIIEFFFGKAVVVNVTLNRAARQKFFDTLSGVISFQQKFLQRCSPKENGNRVFKQYFLADWCRIKACVCAVSRLFTETLPLIFPAATQHGTSFGLMREKTETNVWLLAFDHSALLLQHGALIDFQVSESANSVLDAGLSVFKTLLDITSFSGTPALFVRQVTVKDEKPIRHVSFADAETWLPWLIQLCPPSIIGSVTPKTVSKARIVLAKSLHQLQVIGTSLSETLSASLRNLSSSLQQSRISDCVDLVKAIGPFVKESAPVRNLATASASRVNHMPVVGLASRLPALSTLGMRGGSLLAGSVPKKGKLMQQAIQEHKKFCAAKKATLPRFKPTSNTAIKLGSKGPSIPPLLSVLHVERRKSPLQVIGAAATTSSNSSEEEHSKKRKATVLYYDQEDVVKPSRPVRMIETVSAAPPSGSVSPVLPSYEVRYKPPSAKCKPDTPSPAKLRARLEPNLDDLHRKILEWDFRTISSFKIDGLSEIPLTFSSIQEYENVFEPLLLTECKEQIIKGIEEISDQDARIFKTMGTDVVDDFTDIVVAMTPSSPAFASFNDIRTSFRDYSENDLVVFSEISEFEGLTSANAILKDICEPLKFDDESSHAPAGARTRMTFLAKISTVIWQPGQPRIRVRSLLGRERYDIRMALREGTRWMGFRIQNLVTINREFQALKGLSHYSLSRQILCPTLAPLDLEELSRQSLKLQSTYDLNEPQAKAVFAATSQDGFVLCKGPPGTGKTKTIVAMIGALLSESTGNVIPIPGQTSNGVQKRLKNRILVCAPSNAAVDEIAKRLKVAGGVRNVHGKELQPTVVRWGVFEQIHSDVRDIAIDTLVNAEVDKMNLCGNSNPDEAAQSIKSLRQQLDKFDAEIEELNRKITALQGYKELLTATEGDDEGMDDLATLSKNLADLKSQKHDVSQQLFREREEQRFNQNNIEAQKTQSRNTIAECADIICATLSGCGQLSSSISEFDYVIIDEAAQAVELSALIPFKYNCKRCIMVGDPNQLPPTVMSSEATLYMYDRSLYERIQSQSPESVHFLSIQYRMHPDISLFPGQLFYEGKLSDAANMANLRTQPYHSHSLFKPYTFFDITCGKEDTRRGRSLFNAAEAEACALLVNRISQEYPEMNFGGKIGVITPYKQQLRELKDVFTRRFGSEILNEVDINTVDGFQGREADIIILTCVRAHSGGIGFLSDIRRMNVALTRAKSTLIVLGNSKSLCVNSNWKSLIDDAKRRMCYQFVSSLNIFRSNQNEVQPNLFRVIPARVLQMAEKRKQLQAESMERERRAAEARLVREKQLAFAEAERMRAQREARMAHEARAQQEAQEARKAREARDVEERDRKERDRQELERLEREERERQERDSSRMNVQRRAVDLSRDPRLWPQNTADLAISEDSKLDMPYSPTQTYYPSIPHLEDVPYSPSQTCASQVSERADSPYSPSQNLRDPRKRRVETESSAASFPYHHHSPPRQQSPPPLVSPESAIALIQSLFPGVDLATVQQLLMLQIEQEKHTAQQQWVPTAPMQQFPSQNAADQQQQQQILLQQLLQQHQQAPLAGFPPVPSQQSPSQHPPMPFPSISMPYLTPVQVGFTNQKIPHIHPYSSTSQRSPSPVSFHPLGADPYIPENLPPSRSQLYSFPANGNPSLNSGSMAQSSLPLSSLSYNGALVGQQRQDIDFIPFIDDDQRQLSSLLYSDCQDSMDAPEEGEIEEGEIMAPMQC